MQISPIYNINNRYKFHTLPQKASVYNKNNLKADTVSFGNENLIWAYTYPMSLIEHEENIENTSPEWVENYFGAMSIPASFKKGDEYSNKFVAFCCFHAAEIFRQINFPLPTKIELFDFRNIGDKRANYAVGVCLPVSRPDLGFPLRTVGFNTYEDKAYVKSILASIKDTKIGTETFKIKDSTSYWRNHFLYQNDAKKTDFATTSHFLHPFIHEFCHSLHFNQLYTNYGCPELNPLYRYNPAIIHVLNSMNVQVNDRHKRDIYHPYNSFITNTARAAIKNSSEYGATLLPELFAEEMTKSIINNIDLISLRLKPGAQINYSTNPILSSVLYEVYNGLINDNQGLV